MAHYQPRHSSQEVARTSARPRRSRVVGIAVAGAVIVAAAIVMPLMASGGGGAGPTTTARVAAPTTTGTSPAPTTVTSATTGASTSTDSHVSTRGAGSAGPTTTQTTRVATTTTLPRLNPAASTSPANNIAAPNGLGVVLTSLWADGHPGGVSMTVADVASVLPGSVFYAEQPAIGTYWAISRFVPSAHAQSEAGTTAGNALLAQFNATAMFVKVPGKDWAYLGEYVTTACGQAVPAPVLSSWGMCS